MPVAYDNDVSATDFGVTTITTGSFTVGASATGMGVLATLVAPGAISAFSLGGVAGSAVASASGNDGTWWLTLYKFLSVPSGSQTGTCTWANSSSAWLGFITATGADDVDGGNYAQAAANNVGIQITSASGDLTATFSADQNTGTAHSTNQTIRISSELVGADTGPGTGTTTHTWTHTGAFACNAVGANFVAAGGATFLAAWARFANQIIQPGRA